MLIPPVFSSPLEKGGTGIWAPLYTMGGSENPSGEEAEQADIPVSHFLLVGL